MVKTLAFVIWFIAASAAVIWVGQQNIDEFDYDQRLSMAMMSMDFESSLVDTLRSDYPELFDNDSPLLLHIRGEQDCFCERLAEPHTSQLNHFAKQHQYQTANISIGANQVLADFVPSTPAVIFLTKEKTLGFIGPYSSGAGCFGTYGYIDGYLEKYSNNKQPTSSVIINEAAGCYCAQKRTNNLIAQAID